MQTNQSWILSSNTWYEEWDVLPTSKVVVSSLPYTKRSYQIKYSLDPVLLFFHLDAIIHYYFSCGGFLLSLHKMVIYLFLLIVKLTKKFREDNSKKVSF